MTIHLKLDDEERIAYGAFLVFVIAAYIWIGTTYLIAHYFGY